VSLTTEQQSQLDIVEKRIEKREQDLIDHQKEYQVWSQKKADIINAWAEDLEVKYTILDKPLTTIAKDIVDRLKFLGISEGATKYVYEALDKEYKRSYTKFEDFTQDVMGIYENSKVGNPTITEKKWDSWTPDQKIEHVNNLEQQRRDLDKKLDKEGIDRSKPKTGPRETQRKPPVEQQGPSKFSEELGNAAARVRKIYDGLLEIQEKAEIYKVLDPERDAQMAKDFKETITDGIFDTLAWYFVPAKDDKWSNGHMRWMETMLDRIDQSKHAAGKLNQDYVTDPITGRIMLDKKGNPIKRFISRERVGDAEKPVFETSVRMIRCIKGLAWLEYWIEKDIGGYRRHRKWLLHDYFQDAAFGSNASGGPDLKYSDDEKAEIAAEIEAERLEKEEMKRLAKIRLEERDSGIYSIEDDENEYD